MVIVGLTGSVGTGKSTVANLFKELGAYVIDWDELAREVTRPHLKAWKEIVEYFGKGILNEDLTINRQKLADIVFSDKEKVAKLNQIVHPEVFKEDERITDEIRSLDPDALIIKGIPLLFELTRPVYVDKIVVVSASEQTQLRRLEEKGITREDARNRIKSQLPLEEKIKSADFVINNDGPLEETKKQVEEIYSSLRKGEQHGKQR
ncbi:MAG: dephospho-CoA kinase [Dehalococcoidia bacterium]|nr:dephospho-CoA kinase [Dehalococcoidia bacterium]